jgi:hypothetical protein
MWPTTRAGGRPVESVEALSHPLMDGTQAEIGGGQMINP